MAKRNGAISNEAVLEATGKTWEDWYALLDESGAREMTHKQIAQWLSDKGHIESGWWCQTVTVGYERARGRRALGETSGGFGIGVQKSVPVSAEAAWKMLLSKKGREIWLGAGLVSIKEGTAYETEEGIAGEIRVVKPGSHLRLTWQPAKWKKPSTLQIRVLPRKEKTALSFHHEGLPGSRAREEMKKHWKEIAERLAEELVKKQAS